MKYILIAWNSFKEEIGSIKGFFLTFIELMIYMISYKILDKFNIIDPAILTLPYFIALIALIKITRLEIKIKDIT